MNKPPDEAPDAEQHHDNCRPTPRVDSGSVPILFERSTGCEPKSSYSLLQTKSLLHDGNDDADHGNPECSFSNRKLPPFRLSEPHFQGPLDSEYKRQRHQKIERERRKVPIVSNRGLVRGRLNGNYARYRLLFIDGRPTEIEFLDLSSTGSIAGPAKRSKLFDELAIRKRGNLNDNSDPRDPVKSIPVSSSNSFHAGTLIIR